MITIYTLTYNEELMMQFMIDHYRSRFPGCRIIVYDSKSTDGTIKIALENGCELRTFEHKGGFKESRHGEIKNSCWKDALTDWVLMCDVDELLDIKQNQLEKEEKLGTSVIRAKAYDMISMDKTLNLLEIKYGARDLGEDKAYLFNKKLIREINYGSGSHTSNPQGKVVYSKNAYRLYHYCFINYDVTVERYRVFRERIDPKDQENSGFYSETPEQIRQIYAQAWDQAVKVR